MQPAGLAVQADAAAGSMDWARRRNARVLRQLQGHTPASSVLLLAPTMALVAAALHALTCSGVHMFYVGLGIS